jgi:hypothetical protein
MQKLSALFMVILLMALCISVTAQDRIVTISGDTITGSITRVTNSSIQYETILEGVKTSGRINRNHVQSWMKNESGSLTELPVMPGYEQGRFRISIQGGYGYRTGSTKDARQAMINTGFSADAANSYYRAIKFGMQGSGQVHYMFWQQNGLGIDYNFFYSKASASGNMDPGDGYTRIYGTMSEDIYTQFAGLSWYTHQWISPARLKYYSILSVGLAMYRNETRIIYSPVLLTGNSLGTNLETGLEYFFSEKIALGIGLSYFQSTLGKVTVNNGSSIQEVELEDKQREGLGRLNLSAGLKIYF